MMVDKADFTDSFAYEQALQAEAAEAARPMLDELPPNADKSPMTFKQIESLKQEAATDSLAYYTLKEMGVEVTK